MGEDVVFARPITLMQPERIVMPPPWIGHIPFAFWLVDVMRPRRFVELGTHSGNSFCAFLQAAAAVSSTGEFRAVDHWMGDEHAGEYGESVYRDLSRYVETRYGNASALLRMSFDEAVDRFEDASIDLLHIDGLHTYEAVRHDFETWLPKMSGRGVVLFHDTAVRKDDFGVYRLFAELAQRYPSFEFVHSYGLGVIQTGTEEPGEPLARLFRGAVDDRGVSARDYFERLGGALVDRYYLQRLADDVERRSKLEAELAAGIGRKEQIEGGLLALPPVGRAARGPADQTGGREIPARLDARAILASGFFDPRAYRSAAGLDGLDDLALAEHYVETGEAAGLAPSRHFDPGFYRDENPDVAAQRLNMLIHYLANGRAEGRLPRPEEPAPRTDEPAPPMDEPEEDKPARPGARRPPPPRETAAD